MRTDMTSPDEQEFIFCSYPFHLYILLFWNINTKDFYAKIFAKQVQIYHADLFIVYKCLRCHEDSPADQVS